ncbi:MAG: GerMN domain-containing protein [Gracilibacteraceae bacterium]|jgi:hypothetical protein|nr:GerMN domain-containing protein [Gracilibacteraceae bacterium]
MVIKRITIWICAAALIPLLAACGSAPSPPPAETPAVPATLYLPGENAIGFTTATVLTDGTPEDIVSWLVREKALPEGSALLDFTIDGDGSCRADMNAAYGASLGQGTSAEYQLLGSLVNTLLTHFEQSEITLTIEGETPATGHNVYDFPLRFFD